MAICSEKRTADKLKLLEAFLSHLQELVRKMAFSSSLSRERASLTKQARIYSDQHNDQTSRFYEDAKRDGIYAEVEVEEGREGDRRRMNVVEKPQLLNVSIISFLSCMRKILPSHPKDAFLKKIITICIVLFSSSRSNLDMCPQARQVNLGTGVTQIFITGEEASLEDISVASTEVGLALNKAYAHKTKPKRTRISLSTLE